MDWGHDLRLDALVSMKAGAAALAVFAAVWFFLNRMGGEKNGAVDVALIEANLAIANLSGGDVVNMKLSEAGLQAIAQREGFGATRYRDASGYSIGYGHYIQAGESFSEPMSREDAGALLLADSEIAQKAVRAYVKVSLTQAQFDALVSMVYNIGSGNFRTSTTLRLINAGDLYGAAGAMLMFNKSGGVVLASLDRRRAEEYQQFLG